MHAVFPSDTPAEFLFIPAVSVWDDGEWSLLFATATPYHQLHRTEAGALHRSELAGLEGTTFVLNPAWLAWERGLKAAIALMNGRVDLRVQASTGAVTEIQLEAARVPDGPLLISGALNGIFMDPAHSGEGLNIQVLRLGTHRILDIAWFTYQPDGTPFWLGGSAKLEDDDRTARVELFYTDAGGFAGSFGNDVQRKRWGTMEIEFDSCHAVRFTYDAKDGLPGDVPTGEGVRVWQRLARVDRLHCG